MRDVEVSTIAAAACRNILVLYTTSLLLSNKRVSCSVLRSYCFDCAALSVVACYAMTVILLFDTC
jgi:hypothetical protein